VSYFGSQLTSVARVESQTTIPRIGYVSGSGTADNPGPYVEALRQGLRDLGYAEKKNFLIEYRGAQGKPDRLQPLKWQ
jgi:putative tryptophan/tyrosine transport system substrate-binding protein